MPLSGSASLVLAAAGLWIPGCLVSVAAPLLKLPAAKFAAAIQQLFKLAGWTDLAQNSRYLL